MKIRTGQTIYEAVLSLDTNNNPISAATFTTALYNNGQNINSVINISLTDNIKAVFAMSWSAETFGNYQMYAKNDITNVI